MHNNFYFLRQLSPQLKREILGMKLNTCFSQLKNELVLGFSNTSQEFYIRAYLHADFSCLSFPTAFARARKNTADIFHDIVDLSVLDVVQFKNERCFAIDFSGGFRLVFKLFGNRSNLILFKNGINIAVFKNNLAIDKNLVKDEFDRDLNQDYSTFAENDGNVKNVFPTFGPLVKNYLQLKNYGSLSIEKKWELVNKLTATLEQPKTYYVTVIDKAPVLSLINIGTPFFETKDPIEAINYFFGAYTKTYYLEKEKNALVQKLTQLDDRADNYIAKAEKRLQDIEEHLGYDKIANIIMANLHAIPPKAKEVELFNFYTESTVKITLNRNLSPQKNAENFYRKSKNQKIEIEKTEENIQNQLHKKTDLEKQIKELGSIDNLREFNKYIKANNLSLKKDSQTKTLPFKSTEINGFQVLIGKNAKNNDLLTQKYAYKEDLWLHAKDVAGSHVVIKFQAGKIFPKTLIEKAAQLAAYYSQRKTDSLCPVIVTPKKFVRKPKGAAPGSVVVEKEKVILVKPLSLQDYAINE